MKGMSLIIVTTLDCNADCRYCYQAREKTPMEFENLRTILTRVFRYAGRNGVEHITLYWHGGEPLTHTPDWFHRAHDLVQELETRHKLEVTNCIQSNLIGYHGKWKPVIKGMFGGGMGSSLDFPNLHRRPAGGDPESFNRLWVERYRQAREDGINVQVISVLNHESLKAGAEAFYSYYFDEVKLERVQINNPFPAGPPNEVKKHILLSNRELVAFAEDLLGIMVREGRGTINPFDALINYFRFHDGSALPCLWCADCSHILSVTPNGNLSPCDCFVTTHPELRMGNILESDDVAALMEAPVQKALKSRAAHLTEKNTCGNCSYLYLCHGGCPAQAFSSTGKILSKDPYCDFYKRMFKFVEQKAYRLPLQAAESISGRVPTACGRVGETRESGL